jgi:myosin heavy subunit
MLKNDERKSASIEEKLLEQYGGRGSNTLPQTLMFDHVSPATRLLEKRRQMFEVQEALNSQKEEFSRREDAFRRREDGLRRKDLELQESLIKFNKFLQENESKRNRALKRSAEEKKQREMKEKEIEKLKIQLATRKKEESLQKLEVERNLKYQDYLDSVVINLSKFFPEISDILNRYKTLRDANQHLIEKHKQQETLNDSMQRDYANLKKSSENTVLNNTNAIAEKQLVLEHRKAYTMREQAEIEKVAMEASEKGLELGQINASVANILERCEESFRIRHNKPLFERAADKMSTMGLVELCALTESKLDDIAMFMVDYRDIIQEYAMTHDFVPLSAPKLRAGGGNNASQQVGTAGSDTLTGGGRDGNHSKSQISLHDTSTTVVGTLKKQESKE